MTTGGRLAAAGACFVAGVCGAWAFQHLRRHAPLSTPLVAPDLRQHDPRSTATLRVLAVGVSRYRDPTLNLRFADADAAAIAAALEQQRGGSAVADAHDLIIL